MGYRYLIKTDRPVRDIDITNIVNKMPEELQGPFNCNRQPWGWSCICDIQLDNNIVSVSGSYGVSGKESLKFVTYLQGKLQNAGYKIIDREFEG